MEAILTRLFLIVIVILCIKYDYLIFIPFILGIYFFFDKSWWNLLVLVGYFLILFLLASEMTFLFYSSIILLLIIIFTNYFSGSKNKSGDDMGDIDFSKLFGNMQ